MLLSPENKPCKYLIKRQPYIIENKTDYQNAIKRYEEVKLTHKGSPRHKEKMLPALLINQYENKQSILPEVDPIELIKIRMEDLGYKASDLAREYGDKGTVSKVLNYKQPLSITMIRKFSSILFLPVILYGNIKRNRNIFQTPYRISTVLPFISKRIPVSTLV